MEMFRFQGFIGRCPENNLLNEGVQFRSVSKILRRIISDSLVSEHLLNLFLPAGLRIVHTNGMPAIYINELHARDTRGTGSMPF